MISAFVSNDAYAELPSFCTMSVFDLSASLLHMQSGADGFANLIHCPTRNSFDFISKLNILKKS